MRNALSFLSVVTLVALLNSGCAGPEEKLGRGTSNTYEIVRMGELRQSVEQSAVFDGSYTSGLVSGFNRSMARTGVGIYEVATFPFPPYHPIFTKYLAPQPVYPDNYKPGIWSDSLFDTHTYVGFDGGDIAPYIPGSRFQVFDN